MTQKAYMVMHIENSIGVSINNEECKTPMSLIWADGMIGVSPVFATIEQAEAYAGETRIFEMDYQPLEQE